jgi:sugar phosphate isomerase/epimerase
MRAAAGAIAAQGMPASLWAHAVNKDALLGVQLWSVKDPLAKDFDGTLRALAALGFRRVEAAGWGGRGPEGFRRAVEAAGLRCDSAHFGMDAIAADLHGVAAQARDAGCQYLICASPLAPAPLPPNVDWITAITRTMTLDAWRHNAQLLNQAAAAAAAVGLKVGYHNHVAEFASYDGQRGYDVLLADTDPALVKLELDVAWAVAGGQDPVALIDRLRTRIVRLHLKDVRSRPAPGTLAENFDTVAPGGGVIDWRAVLRAAIAANIEGAYLEVEAPYRQSPLEDLAAGRRHLEKVLASL